MVDLNKLTEYLESDVEYFDFRFTDSTGVTHHVSEHSSSVSESYFTNGVTFDGSSINGWKDIHQSDTIMLPDLSTAVEDPFCAQKTVSILCDVLEPGSLEAYSRDPRSTAKRAEQYLIDSGIGDCAYFAPEAEFFVFDSVRFAVSPNRIAAEVDGSECPTNNWDEIEEGNLSHRPKRKGGYFPLPPVDTGHDMRSEMLSTLHRMGIKVEKHHHEVAPNQHELAMSVSKLLQSCDNLQNYKYVVQNVARAYGKTATFMPKPVFEDNGSGMHLNISLWKNGSSIFAGNSYGGLSDEALYFIGGVFKHARSLNAFTNPSTNSYKRLIPGYEAPVLLAYAMNNRSASCRIPYASSVNAKRVEFRFPDPTCNAYLGFSAVLMAGLDGIRNKIHPGEAMDKDLYSLPESELKNIPTVCKNLEEALNALNDDRKYLLEGGVFSDDLIDGYIQLKSADVEALNNTPHPVEFVNYFSS